MAGIYGPWQIGLDWHFNYTTKCLGIPVQGLYGLYILLTLNMQAEKEVMVN